MAFKTLLLFASIGQVLGDDISEPAAHGTKWQTRNYNTIFQIYNTTIYPNNQAFLNQGISAIPLNLFSPNASGRITPIGNFSGLEDSVEYFFGLTPPVQPPLYDTWTSARLASFTSGCPEVAASVVYGATTGVNSDFEPTFGKTLTTIKQIAFWRFDDEGRVLYYDACLPTLGRYTELLYGIPSTNTTYQTQVINQLCQVQNSLCADTNKQFKSTRECVDILSSKPFGNWDELWADNVICRTLHLLLAKLRPDVHCPHVGPTGGGKCVDVDFNQVYFEDDELLFGMAGDAFVCPGVAT